MPHLLWIVVGALFGLVASQAATAECTTQSEAARLDPVEVSYCAADAVFVATSAGKMETIRSFRPEGAERTMHYWTERNALRVATRYKGKTADTVTLIADRYDQKSTAFPFEREKTYLVFAMRLAAENEYASTSAACPMQPVVVVEEAAKALEQLEQHRAGKQKIDCQNIRAKAAE